MYHVSRQDKILPTHVELTNFVLSLLPHHPRDVPPIYHQPRYPYYNPATTNLRDIVLSITPTSGVYSKLSDLSFVTRPYIPVCFLHRPFDLDRRSLPRGSLVLASHKRFDELLTVGWNVALAQGLGLDLETAVCIQGYKGDPDRRIGLVGKLSQPQRMKDVYQTILREFSSGKTMSAGFEVDVEGEVDCIAIMNAFGADEVARVVNSAVESGFIPEQGHKKLLYLTGEPKELGLTALKETYSGMVAVCVGHREAEEWGIKFLASCIQQTWTDVAVHVILEREEIPSVDRRRGPNPGGSSTNVSERTDRR